MLVEVVEGKLRLGCEVDVEVDLSMETAAEVVEAIAVAEGGSVWLCVPSYVVIRIDKSS